MSNNCFDTFFNPSCRIKIFWWLFNILLKFILDSVLSSFLLNFILSFQIWALTILESWIDGYRNLINRSLSQSLIFSSFDNFLFSVIFEPFWCFSSLILNTLILGWLWNDCFRMIIIPFLNHFERILFVLKFSLKIKFSFWSTFTCNTNLILRNKWH